MSLLNEYLEAAKETLENIPDDYTRASEIFTRIKNGRLKYEDINVPKNVKKFLDIFMNDKLSQEEKIKEFNKLRQNNE